MSAPRTRQVEVRGVRSPVLEAGPQGSDEAVVFLHGNPGSGRDFEDLLVRVGEFARALAPDMPGFGRADRPRDFDYSVPGYAAHLGGLLEELGVMRAHLVLHDFGGPWGLEWAIAHPDALGSLVLLNTGALIRYRWHFLARIWRTPVLGELFQRTTTRFAFKRLVNRLNPKPLPDAFLDRMYDEADRGTDRAVLRLYRASDHPDRMGARHAAALRELRPPALVVWGMGDPYLKPSLGERQREALPDLRFVPIEGAGHWVFADAPEQVAAEVVPFLRAHVGG
jgi:pimeloyl-ACP methyl ester carboxylesterase